MSQEIVRTQEKVGYACGDLASCLYWQTIGSFLLFFYTDVFGISAAAAGTMFLVTRLWDAVNDPIMGTIADRTKTRWGRFRPYLLWLAVPFGVIGVLLFTTPDFSPTGKLVWAYITYNLMMMAYTAINIPYSSLLGVITSDPLDRVRLSTFKFLGAFGGNLAVQAFTLPLVAYFGQGDRAIGFRNTMMLYGTVAVALFLVTFFSVRERVQPAPSQKSRVKEDVRDLSRNKPWLILLAIGLFVLAYVAIRNGVTIYYLKYYARNENLYNWYMVSATIATIIGIFVVGWITKKVGKARMYMILMGISSVLTACLLLAEAAGRRLDVCPQSRRQLHHGSHFRPAVVDVRRRSRLVRVEDRTKSNGSRLFGGDLFAEDGVDDRRRRTRMAARTLPLSAQRSGSTARNALGPADDDEHHPGGRQYPGDAFRHVLQAG